jgi:hypothetical protein
MGSIISSKVQEGGKIIFEVSVEEAEALQLRGNISDIHIFSENVVEHDATLSQRGKNEATKYFLVPKQLRKELSFRNKQVRCQKIDTKTKTIFVYVIERY